METLHQQIYKQRKYLALTTLAGVSISLLATVGFFDQRVYDTDNKLVAKEQINTVKVSEIKNGNGLTKIILTLLGSGILIYSSELLKVIRHNELILWQQIELEEIKQQQYLEAQLRGHQEALSVLGDNFMREALAERLGVDPSVLAAQALETPLLEAAIETTDTVVDNNNVSPTIETVDRTPISAPPSFTIRESISIPDHCRLVKPSELANINEYPNIFVIAAKGEGKTETISYILKQLNGLKVFGSPKANTNDLANWDLVFGFDSTNNKGGWYGNPLDFDQNNESDLTYHYHHQNAFKNGEINYQLDRSMIDFIWAMYRELMNRQFNGADYFNSLGPMRIFFDEASFVYSAGYLDMADIKGVKEKQAKKIIEVTNKSLVMDGRSQLMQVILAAQSDTVETLGLKGCSAARDESWFLYPKRAITKALELKREDIANWLTKRSNQGYATAMLVKNDLDIRLIDLPKVQELK